MLLPQRTLAAPFTRALRQPTTPAGGEVTILTLGGLAQRTVELFWPLVAKEAGFAQPNRPPVFLTLETAQYFMARVVGPLLAEGYFDAIVVDRNRLYSQILDNLNKAALVGFPHTEIGARLTAAWTGESSQARVYAEAQECATRFRDYCLAHNLLDFSLQYELFATRLWPLPQCRAYLLGHYRHIIADNVEEDTPVSHDILLEWLPHCTSAQIIYDTGAGYRRFLGADPVSAYRLKAACEEQITFSGSFAMSPAMDRAERCASPQPGAETGRPRGAAGDGPRTDERRRRWGLGGRGMAPELGLKSQPDTGKSAGSGLAGRPQAREDASRSARGHRFRCASLLSGDAGVGGRRDRPPGERGREAGGDRGVGAVPGRRDCASPWRTGWRRGASLRARTGLRARCARSRPRSAC